MHLKRLLSLSLITTSLLTITACNKREVVPIEVPTTETVVEAIKPAEPIVVYVEPIDEAEETMEVELKLADPNLDYYGKAEEAKASTSTGRSATKENAATPSTIPQDYVTEETQATFGQFEHVPAPYEGGTW